MLIIQQLSKFASENSFLRIFHYIQLRSNVQISIHLFQCLFFSLIELLYAKLALKFN